MAQRKSRSPQPVLYQFVDEAGDLTLFDKKGRILVGNEGSSPFFMIGVAQIDDPTALSNDLEELRRRLFANPFLKKVPSMQPFENKTAVAFHAKDDCAEARHEVFTFLATRSDIKVLVAVRDKLVVATHAKSRFELSGRKITDNEIYDDLLRTVLKNRLHLAEKNEITIARRGTKDRTAALRAAVQAARDSFARKWGAREFPPTVIQTATPSQAAGLQVIDYFLWAIQRLYVRQEDRYFEPLAEKYRLIQDVDDTRRNAYGEYYGDKNKLTLERIKTRCELGST